MIGPQVGRCLRLRITGTTTALLALLIVTVATITCTPAPAGHTVIRLPETFTYLPYRFIHASPSDHARLRFLDVDFDNDGISEGASLSKNRDHGEKFIGVHRYAESQRYSVSQVNLPVKAGLLGVADLTGDGQEELIYFRQHAKLDVEFVVEEFSFEDGGASRHRIGGVQWDARASWMGNHVWGGDADMVAAFDRDGDGTRETLLMSMSTGTQLYPRGFWELNWVAGEIGRSLGTGGSPTSRKHLVDVDGDGDDDLVFGIESPGNGAVSGPFSDNTAYIAAADESLKLIWWREVSGYSARVHPAVADLDGDGEMELAVAIGGHGTQLEDDYSLRVFRLADGEPLARLPYSGPANDLEIADVNGRPRLLASLADGTLRRYSYAGGEFEEDARFVNDEGIASMEIVELGLPSGAPGLIIETAKGTIIACDLDLNPLAAFHTDEAVHIETAIVPTVFPVEGSRVPGAVVQTQERVRFLYVERVWPPPAVRRVIDWLRGISSVLLIALGTLAVAGAALPRYRRQVLGALRRKLLPRRRRETELDEFLEQLKTGGHGKLSATKTLRRLAGQFTMLSQHEGETPDAFDERYHEAVANAREIGLPMVRGIAESAKRLGLAPLSMPDLSRALTGVERAVDGAPGGPPAAAEASAMRTRMDADLKQIERSIGAARRAAERERSSLPSAELARVVSARAVELRQPGLTVNTVAVDVLDGVRVLGTSAELTFVLDNLVGNALRAVRGAGTAEIRVAAAVEVDTVSLQVADTGRGIAPDNHERIFLRGVSEREGGGHGLPRSREILERRGGSIKLVRSAPGEGAVFEVRLKVVSDDI